jgi:1-acyl-sn-glycerol-3-phosphate acyltransferase
MREMNWIWKVGARPVHAALKVVFRLHVEGVTNVPSQGPAILACNHVSVLDGPAVAAIMGSERHRAPHFLIASEVFDLRWGWILRQARQIPIYRGTGDVSALDAVVDAVRAGGVAGIFPEGRVSDDPSAGTQRLRSGISRVAAPVGAPVIPMGIWGTQVPWPRAGLRAGSRRWRPTVAVVVAEPIPPPHADESGLSFRLRLRQAMAAPLLRAQSLVGDAT